MNKPNVQLKKVKTFVGMDGYGLNADVYINGVHCYFVLDEGSGGCMDFTNMARIEKNPAKKKLIEDNCKLLDDYIKTLPPDTYEFGGKTHTMKVDLETYINKLCDEMETEKLRKKNERRMSKLFQTAIVIGKPNEDKYRFMNFKQPLSNIPQTKLVFYVAKLLNEECHDGVKILNTNFKFENGKVTLTL